jgi:hypothetical protein
MALVCGHCGGSWWGGGGHCTNNTRPGTPCNLHNQLHVKFTWFYSTNITVLAKKTDLLYSFISTSSSSAPVNGFAIDS